jgi:hypothetical protein
MRLRNNVLEHSVTDNSLSRVVRTQDAGSSPATGPPLTENATLKSQREVK